MPGPFVPNAELVGIAWVRARSVLTAVAPTLPEREQWRGERFLQIRTIPGGATDIDVPERRTSMLTLDSWAASTTGAPLWRTAAAQLEDVRDATMSRGIARPLDMLTANYLPARVLAAYLASEPARVEGDPSGYARLTCTLAIDWTV